MRKFVFKMKLYPGYKEEYIRRHDEIWPELKDLLIKSGIRDYTIYLDEETDTLIGVQYLEDDSFSQKLGSDQIMQRWWKYMADIMETNPDLSPVVTPLESVFHMENTTQSE